MTDSPKTPEDSITSPLFVTSQEVLLELLHGLKGDKLIFVPEGGTKNLAWVCCHQPGRGQCPL